jgi:hypothetical protein
VNLDFWWHCAVGSFFNIFNLTPFPYVLYTAKGFDSLLLHAAARFDARLYFAAARYDTLLNIKQGVF